MLAAMETVIQGGRRKAYRPLPPEARLAAAHSALAAYDRGDWFLAHELLEPAWMGTADLPERELYQGLIKLAAAHVHAVRGNPAGVAKNLAGAFELLGMAREGSPSAARALGLDLAALVARIEARRGRRSPPTRLAIRLPRRAPERPA